MLLAYRRSQRGRFRLLRVPESARHPLLRAPCGHRVQPGRPPREVCIQAEAERSSAGIGRGLPVCIFDFKNDYSERSFVEAIGLKVYDVRKLGLPFNPLMPSFNAEGLAQPIEHIFTITGVLKRVFGLGARQHAVLRDAMKEAFKQRGTDLQSWVRARA